MRYRAALNRDWSCCLIIRLNELASGVLGGQSGCIENIDDKNESAKPGNGVGITIKVIC